MIISEKFPVKKILVVGILLVLGSLGVKGQRVYANQQRSGSSSGLGFSGDVENATNASNNIFTD